jgi:hypothetical protein
MIRCLGAKKGHISFDQFFAVSTNGRAVQCSDDGQGYYPQI